MKLSTMKPWPAIVLNLSNRPLRVYALTALLARRAFPESEEGDSMVVKTVQMPVRRKPLAKGSIPLRGQILDALSEPEVISAANAAAQWELGSVHAIIPEAVDDYDAVNAATSIWGSYGSDGRELCVEILQPSAMSRPRFKVRTVFGSSVIANLSGQCWNRLGEGDAFSVPSVRMPPLHTESHFRSGVEHAGEDAVRRFGGSGSKILQVTVICPSNMEDLEPAFLAAHGWACHRFNPEFLSLTVIGQANAA